MVASPMAKMIHGAARIRSIPVIGSVPKWPALSSSVHPVEVRDRCSWHGDGMEAASGLAGGGGEADSGDGVDGAGR